MLDYVNPHLCCTFPNSIFTSFHLLSESSKVWGFPTRLPAHTHARFLDSGLLVFLL